MIFVTVFRRLPKDATLTLDAALAGRRDALNPAELLLAALSART